MPFQEALGEAVENFVNVYRSDGSRAVKLVYGGDIFLEPAYLLTKLVKLLNLSFDTCIRLCHYLSHVASKRQLGDTFSGRYRGFLENADAVLIAGSNPSAHHGGFWHELQRARALYGTRVVTVDPRRTRTVEGSDLHLSIDLREYILVFNTVSNLLIEKGFTRGGFIAEHTVGFKTFEETVAKYTVDYLSRRSSLNVETLLHLVGLLGEAVNPRLVGGVALTQTVDGVDVASAFNNLGLLLGSPPRYLRGKMNVQGVHEVLQIPSQLFLKPRLPRATVREHFEVYAEDCISDRYTDAFKFMYVVKEDPALSHPCLRKVWRRLEDAFVVVQDATWRNHTIELEHAGRRYLFADVVFASAMVHECAGTTVNDERVLRRSLPISQPYGEALEDYRIIREFAKGVCQRLGLSTKLFDYPSVGQVFDELAERHPRFFNLSYDRVSEGGTTLPAFLKPPYKFVSVEYKPLPVERSTDAEYPYWATIHRLDVHYNTGAMSRRSKTLNQLCGEPFAEVNPLDTERLNIAAGSMIRVESKLTGEAVILKAVVSGNVKPGVVSLPLHFAEAPVNLLTLSELSPELKDVPVKIVRV